MVLSGLNLHYIYSLIMDYTIIIDGCVSGPDDKHACSQDETVSNAASRMCDRLMKDPKFNQCRKVKPLK